MKKLLELHELYYPNYDHVRSLKRKVSFGMSATNPLKMPVNHKEFSDVDSAVLYNIRSIKKLKRSRHINRL